MYTILSTKTIIKGSYADPKKEPGIFPIVNLPLDAEGEDMELNDFQWVAPTDKWLEWLKENPREWQAESEDSRYEFDDILVESYSTEEDPYLFLFQPQNYDQPTSESYLQSYDEFVQIYEEESDSGSEELTGRAVKLAFALEKLNKEGKLKEELNPGELDKAKEYAIIIDPVDSAKNEVLPSGRTALRFKLLSQDKDTISVGKIDYSLLTDEDLPDNMTAEEQSEWLKRALDAARDVGVAGVWGVTTYGVASAAATLAGGYFALDRIRKWMNRGTTPPAPPPGPPPPAGPGWWSKTRTLLSGTRAASGLRALHVAAAGSRLGSLFGGAAAAAAGGSAVAGAGIAAAAVAVISAAQQIYNWSSTNQAPVYNKLKAFAKDSFVPKNIPAGDLITVCWTADGGKGIWGNITNIFGKDDTRTTMNLMKLANTEKKAVFLLLSVNSEQIQKEMNQSDAVLFSFDLDSDFYHTWIDNKDLEFQIIRVKPLSDFSTPTSFVAYCEWSELESAFDSAPDSPFVVPADAPDTYVFNYKQGDQRANIQGSLLSAETIASQRSLFESDSADLSDVVFISSTSVLEDNKALGFNEFWSSNSISLFEEDKNSAEESKKDSKSVQLGISKDSDYSQIEIIVYEVSSNQFANPNASGNPLEVNYFVVDKQSLSATDGQSVKVESAKGERFQDAKYGLYEYKESAEDSKKGDKNKDEEEPELKPIPGPKSDKDSGTFLTSPDDVSIKDRTRRTVIKDKPTDKEEDVNIVDDILTDDDKKALGIQDWKTLTKIVLVKDKQGYPEKVILKNQTQGRDRIRRIKRGESGFETAVQIADKVKKAIKYK